MAKKVGFLKGMIRINTINHGDIEGSVTQLLKGKKSISVLKDGSVVAWLVNAVDIVLSKENVQSVELVKKDVHDNGKIYDVYTVSMKNGESGTMRLVKDTAEKVLLNMGFAEN